MANLSRIAFVLRTIPNLNSEEITGIYPGELFLVGDKKAIFYKQVDGTVISPSEAASTFLTIESNLEELPDKKKARENLELKSAALKDAGSEKGQLYSVGDLNSFVTTSTVTSSLDFNTYNFSSNEVIIVSKASVTNIPNGLDLATVSVINVLATGSTTDGGFVAIISDLDNSKPTYLVRCSITNSVRTYSVESIYTSKHKPSSADLSVFSKDEANSRFLQIANLFSEIESDEDKALARLNLDLGSASTLNVGSDKGDVLLVGDNGLGVNSNPVKSIKSVIPAFYQLADDSPDKPEADKDYGVLSFPISKTLTGYLVLSSDGVLSLGIDGADGVELSKVYLANNLPTLNELKALGTENNLSDIKDKVKARTNLGLGDSATKNVGTETGTVAAGNDARIVGAVQVDKNLDDLTDKSKARTNLGLGTAAQKKVQTSTTDETSGSLMAVGAFGIGGLAIRKTASTTPDIKTFLNTAPSGIYHFDEANAYVNGPSGLFTIPSNWFDLIVTSHETAGYKTAIAINADGEMCLGIYNASAWKGWVPIYNEYNGGLILPIGVPIPYPLATPPKNFLKANGSAFDQVAFPKLLSYYPSGYLPDLRGEFIRGWDDGRNVDTGRAILSAQGWLTGSHRHAIKAFDIWDNTVLLTNDKGGDSVLSTDNAVQAVNGSYNSQYVTELSGGSETRPRNIAFNYIIRAK